jgi:Flp pilus assembly secretin CpaC
MKLAMCGFALLLATLGFSQQQPPPYTTPPTFPEEPQMPPDHKAPPPVGLSTTEVEQQIQEHFNAEPALANTNVGVTADESSVVLTGTVDSEVQHDLALRIAQSYVGDRKLVDKIRVPE